MTQPAAGCLVLTMLAVANLTGPAMVASMGSAAQTRDRFSLLLVVDITASAWTQLFSDSVGTLRLNSRTGLTWSDRLRLAVDEHFIAKLPAGAHARIGLGSYRLTLSDQFTDDRGHLSRSWRALLSVSREEHAGPSRIWDVTVSAVQALAKERGPRSLILITDGHATRNRLTADDVINAARENAVAIHVISVALDRELRQLEGPPVVLRPNAALRQIAESTGGAFLSRDSSPMVIVRTESDIKDWGREWGRRWPDPGQPLDELMKRIGNTR